jgi:hypothetical protein
MFCCCCGLQDNGVSLTRRSLLGLAAAVPLAAGCHDRHRPVGLAGADETAITSAVAAERALLARYDEAIAQLDAVAAGPLTRARDRHRLHLRALAARSPSTSATPSAASAAPSGSVSTALAATVTTLQAAAVAARSGHVAALLASIAAEHAADAAAPEPEPA